MRGCGGIYRRRHGDGVRVPGFYCVGSTAVLNAAVEVFRNLPVKEALFHTFRRNAGSIRIKKEEA